MGTVEYNMGTLCYIVLLFSSVISVQILAEDSSWTGYKTRYGKHYKSLEEEQYRKSVWLDELQFIAEHNSEAEVGHHIYTLGENEFSDQTLEEFLVTMTGYNDTTDAAIETEEVVFPESLNFPSEWDCRDHGLVTTVRSQGSCGSCWAFSAVGTLEGAWAKHSGHLIRLSEQELVDCDKGEGGCHGGGISSALTWVHNHHGLMKKADYPYHGHEGTCHHDNSETVATLSKVRHVQSKNEDDLKRAVHNRGPVSISLHVNKKFKSYKRGVFSDVTCPRNSPNHALLVVGWKYSSAQKITKWFVKNSWGKSWGQDGYINILEGKNICGMANSPLYAEV